MSSEAQATLSSVRPRLEAGEGDASILAELQNALDAFKAASDTKGYADAYWLKLIAQQQHFQVIHRDALAASAEAPADVVEAEEVAIRELEGFRQRGDKYGEACILVGLSDLALCRCNRLPQLATVAAERATAAQALFQSLKEPLLAAKCSFSAAAVKLQARDWQSALATARATLAQFQALPDTFWIAKSHQLVADSLLQSPATRTTQEAVTEALSHGNRALKLFEELGRGKHVALQCQFLASCHHYLGSHRTALPYAQQAAASPDLTGDGRIGEAKTTVIKLLGELGRWKEARKVGWAGVKLLRDSTDKRSLVLLLHGLTILLLESPDGDLAEASQLAEEAEQVCKELKDKKWQANQVFNQGQIQVREQRFSAAEQRVLEACALDDELGRDLERANKQQLLVMIHAQQGKPEEALRISNEIRAVYQDHNLKVDEAAACLLVAQCQAQLKDLQKAFDTASEAKTLFQEEGDKQGESEAWNLIGKLQRMGGEAQEAEKAMHQAKSLSQKAGDARAQVQTLLSLGQAAVAESRFEDALKAGFEALMLARTCQCLKVEIQVLMFSSQAQLASMLKRSSTADGKPGLNPKVRERELRQALRHAREAVVLAKKSNDKQLTAAATLASAQALLLGGHADAAMRSTNTGLEVWQGLESKVGIAYATLLLAECHFAKSEHQVAENLANEALAAFTEIDEKEGMERAKQTLARFKESARLGGVQALPAADAEEEEAEADSTAEASAPKKEAMSLEAAQQLAMEVALTAIGTDEDLDFDTPLMDMGLDSLSSIAFREQLIASSGLQVPSSLVFDYPSLQAIAEHLVEVSGERT
mmetsp:Transcript_53697/g.114613  ORF Transcript_53697/g.114613 Transcript_53697/m.114613 type:complete len:823 (+) Transcript_53697:84-2552(+)